MGKIIISTLISILPFTQLSHPHEEDPFTTYIQEKLIELGYLEVATGVNDKTSQAAIKLFQEKSGLIVDGMVGENTFLQLMLAENPTDNNSSVTSSSAEDLVIDDKPPVWDEEQPPYASEIGSLFNLNMPSVNDNVGIVSYEVYVNGALSSYATISDSTLLVTPKYDMTCADQLIYVIAFDEAGNSSQSPTFTIPKSDLCISSSSSSSSSSQSYFAVSFGGTSGDQGQGIAVDSSGNSYITGNFQDTVDFGEGDVTSAGNNDIFVLKLNSSGTLQWVNTYAGSLNDQGLNIAVDSSGNSYITGYFQGTVDFGGGNVTSAGNNDIFVLKLNSSGTFQWVQTYGGSENDSVYDLTIDSSNNIIVAGIFRGTVNFGSGNIVSSGGIDAFVLKLNSSGTFQWVQTYGGTSSEFAYSVDVDSSDNLYISGEYSNTVDFGGGAETAEAGHCDIFILKLNSSGTFQWVETLGSFGNDRALHITADSSGNSYTTGEFTSTTNFGGGNVANNGGFDIFVLKLNSSGTFQWVQTYGGTSNDRGQNIQLDSSNNPIIVGQFQETTDFGSGNITSSGSTDIFVLKLNSSGTFQWVQTYGDSTGDSGTGVAVDSSDNILISGYFQGTVDFGGGDVTSIGGNDIFVLKLNSSGQYSN